MICTAKTEIPVARAVRNATRVIPWYLSEGRETGDGEAGGDVSDVVDDAEEGMVPFELKVAEIVAERAVDRDEASEEASVSVSEAEPDGVAVGVADMFYCVGRRTSILKVAASLGRVARPSVMLGDTEWSRKSIVLGWGETRESWRRIVDGSFTKAAEYAWWSGVVQVCFESRVAVEKARDACDLICPLLLLLYSGDWRLRSAASWQVLNEVGRDGRERRM